MSRANCRNGIAFECMLSFGASVAGASVVVYGVNAVAQLFTSLCAPASAVKWPQDGSKDVGGKSMDRTL